MSNPKTIDSTAAEDTIDLGTLFDILLRGKWFILACVFIAVAGAAFYCRFRIPVYQTNILLSIGGSSSNSAISSLVKGGNESSGGSFFANTLGSISTEQYVLTSRSILTPIIQKLNLDVIVTPRYFPYIGHRLALDYDNSNYAQTIAPPRFGLSNYAWGGTQVIVTQFSVSSNLKSRPFILHYLGNDHYAIEDSQGKRLSEGTVGQALTIQINSYSRIQVNIQSIRAPAGAVFQIEQQSMNTALENLQQSIQVKQPNQYSSLLEVTMSGSDPAQITTVLNAVGEQAVAYSIDQTSQQAAQVLSFIRDRLPKAQQSLAAAQSKLNDYRAESGNIELNAQTGSLLSEDEKLEGLIWQAKLQKIQLLKQYPANSYPLQQIDIQIAQYQQKQAELSQQLRLVPKADQTLMTLTRDATIQNGIYTSLLSSLQQYELIKAATIGAVSVVDTASIPYSPTMKPARSILMIATALGLIIGAALVFLKAYIINNVEDVDVIEYRLGLPVLAMLNENQEQKLQHQKLKKRLLPRLQLMSEIDPQHIVVESLRSLRTSVLFKLPRKTGNIITISGPSPEVGKSFVSANLAHILAEGGQRVLLIDADIRRGDLYHYFEVAHKPGFTDVIQGTASEEAVIHTTRIPNLDFMASGSSTSHHAELLMRSQCTALLKHLATQYDIILIDTAPVLALTDATILGAHADLRLLVIGYGRHHYQELEHTVSLFTKVGQKIDGAIFNRVPFKAKDYYGKYYYYRYNYRSRKKS